MVTAYQPVVGGRMSPIIPRHCPFGGDGEECRVGAHGRRERKRGPGFALVVAVCHAHGRHFTLYPPGWTPWGRVPVLPSEESETEAWESTLFVAPMDAASGVLWPELSVGAVGCARTQGRWIRRCGQWLGLGSVDDVEHAAGTLGVPLSVLHDAHRGFAGANRRLGGRVIADVLRERSWSLCDWRRLLVVGARSGVCGRAWITALDGMSQPVFRH